MAAELATTLEPTEADRLLQAEALVRAYCGWHIAPSRTDEEYVVPATSRVVLLPSLLVTAVAVADPDGVTVDASSYSWTDAGVVTPTSWWLAGTTITFTHGYAEPPADVTAVVQSVAQRAVQNPGSLVRKQVGPFADTYSQTGSNQSLPIALLDAEKAILDRYRIPPRP